MAGHAGGTAERWYWLPELRNGPRYGGGRSASRQQIRTHPLDTDTADLHTIQIGTNRKPKRGTQ
jgi:hypothetical protein